MKNITFSADEHLISKAREKAMRENTTLNVEFRDWLVRYVGNQDAGSKYDSLMSKLKHVKAKQAYSRDELNER